MNEVEGQEKLWQTNPYSLNISLSSEPIRKAHRGLNSIELQLIS